MLKERVSAVVEEGRNTVIAGSGVTRKAVAGSRRFEPQDDLFLAGMDGRRGTDGNVAVGSGVMTAAGSRPVSSEIEGDFLQCEVEGRPTNVEEEQRSLSKVKASLQKRRAVIRVESGETQDHVSAPRLTNRMEQRMEAEKRGINRGVMRHPECNFYQIAAIVAEDGGAAHTIN